ncbi:MAG: ribose transport system substrate-binding protein [Acidobacteriaceae bacterium]|jgi:ribose transport system substrate-binding protein
MDYMKFRRPVSMPISISRLKSVLSVLTPRRWKSIRAGLLSLASTAVMFFLGCHSEAVSTIALIPRTSGMGLWEPAHRGADSAAARLGARIYWNAPTREDDVESQIALVEQVTSRRYQGLVLAPDQALALITPVHRALEVGIPTVVVSSQLAIPGGGRLSYVLNDDEAGGRLAAQRVAELLHSKGSVVVLGVNPDITGIMIRARSFELFLAQNYPNIHVSMRRGAFNILHEQQIAEQALKNDPDVKVIVGLMWASARGAISALGMMRKGRRVKVIGFDPDGALPFATENFDSAIMQDTRAMGELAVDLIGAERHGHPMPASIKLQPALATRQNIDTPEIRRLTSMEWKPGSWKGSMALQ